jgi:hypothetical protein
MQPTVIIVRATMVREADDIGRFTDIPRLRRCT